jgi:hypothetical protein
MRVVRRRRYRSPWLFVERPFIGDITGLATVTVDVDVLIDDLVWRTGPIREGWRGSLYKSSQDGRCN